MSCGLVNRRLEAVVRLKLRGPRGAELLVDAVVDTGFTSSLALPPDAVASLGLSRQCGGEAVLADGSVRQFDIHSAEVEWDGSWIPVMVSAVGTEVLMGMRLLAGHRLTIEAVPAGTVSISPLN